MSARDQIIARVDKLSPELQDQVLRFVAGLAAPALKGERGADLRPFSGSLDPDSAREMMRAIEEECERVDGGDW
jgi:hypothetical protein